MTQVEMARELGIGSEAYRSYETRSLMPHHLVEPFARIIGIDIEELFVCSQHRSGPFA
jgi:DNA-binding XRE family transcriptional regulator